MKRDQRALWAIIVPYVMMKVHIITSFFKLLDRFHYEVFMRFSDFFGHRSIYVDCVDQLKTPPSASRMLALDWLNNSSIVHFFND